MAFVKISDHTGVMETVVFPDLYKESRTFLKDGNLVVIRGKISIRDGEKSIIIDKMKELQ